VDNSEQTVVVNDIEESVEKALPPPPTHSFSHASDIKKSVEVVVAVATHRRNTPEVMVPPTISPAEAKPKELARSTTPGGLYQQGTLAKKGRILGRTVTRWFSLDDKSFNFYRTSHGPSGRVEAKRKIPLKEVTDVSVADGAHGQFAFEVHTAARTYTLSAHSENERTQWITAFKNHMVS